MLGFQEVAFAVEMQYPYVENSCRSMAAYPRVTMTVEESDEWKLELQIDGARRKCAAPDYEILIFQYALSPLNEHTSSSSHDLYGRSGTKWSPSFGPLSSISVSSSSPAHVFTLTGGGLLEFS